MMDLVHVINKNVFQGYKVNWTMLDRLYKKLSKKLEKRLLLIEENRCEPNFDLNTRGRTLVNTSNGTLLSLAPLPIMYVGSRPQETHNCDFSKNLCVDVQ